MERIAELRKICQSVHKGDPSAQIVRAVSIYFTWVFLKARLSANAVSILNVVIGAVAGALYATGSTAGFIGGALLFTMNSILDGVDGEVARYNKKSSLTGLYLDRVNSLFIYPFLFGGMAIGAWRISGSALPLLVGMVGVWASVSVRLAKTTLDTTVIDALTLEKARQEDQYVSKGGDYAPMSEHFRSKGSPLFYLIDFISIRQPGFNIVLIGFTAVVVLLQRFGISSTAGLLTGFLGFYGALFGFGTLYSIFHIARSRRIERTRDAVLQKMLR